MSYSYYSQSFSCLHGVSPPRDQTGSWPCFFSSNPQRGEKYDSRDRGQWSHSVQYFDGLNCSCFSIGSQHFYIISHDIHIIILPHLHDSLRIIHQPFIRSNSGKPPPLDGLRSTSPKLLLGSNAGSNFLHSTSANWTLINLKFALFPLSSEDLGSEWLVLPGYEIKRMEW